MSSRNTYLNPQERLAAAILFRVLSAARLAYDSGECRADKLRTLVRGTVAAESLAKLQYVSCADDETLEEAETVRGKALLSMVVSVGKTMQIDNFVIGLIQKALLRI